MFPSPSDGAPWLSPSPSPALAPWGMLLELEVDDPPLDDPLPDDWVVDEDDEPPLEVEVVGEFDPHAATASAATTSNSAVQRRGDATVTECMVVLLSYWRETVVRSLDASGAIVFRNSTRMRPARVGCWFSHDLPSRFPRPG